MSGIKAKSANGYRIGWGLFFLGSAVFNVVVTIPNSVKVLQAFEGLSIPGADALLRVLTPYAAGLIAAVVAFEALVGVLTFPKVDGPGLALEPRLPGSWAWFPS